METVEHGRIRDKISSVDGLPQGYSPDLQSKWELLEAGLKPAKRKALSTYFVRVGVAAGFLLLAGIMTWKPLSEQAAPVPVASGEIRQVPQADDVPVPDGSGASHAQEPAKPVRRSARKKSPAPVYAKDNRAAAYNDTCTDPLPGPLTGETELAAVPKAKRFVEIDFDRPAVGTHEPEKEVIASQRFRFRVGLGTQTRSGAAGASSPLRISRQLN